MNWFVWRQHRKQFLVLGIILALYAALIIPTGLHFWHSYQSALANCMSNPATPGCNALSETLFQTNEDQVLFHLVPLGITLLPIILGMFWGAPLLAREYTEGTNSLVWTQSVSRRKWLTVKLAWILMATAIFMGAFAALTTWWAKTPNTLNNDRFIGVFFASQGIVPIAYGLFAVAFGTLFGAWFRKTMVAVGVTIGLFVACALIIVPQLVRTHYMHPITVTAPMGPSAIEDKIPQDASWMISRNIVDKNGKVIGDIFPAAPVQCQRIIQQATSGNGSGHGDIRIKVAPGSGDPIDVCLNNAGFHQVASYQPSYRYWDFQRIEAGIYIVLAATAIGATYLILLKRDA